MLVYMKCNVHEINADENRMTKSLQRGKMLFLKNHRWLNDVQEYIQFKTYKYMVFFIFCVHII